MRAFLMLNEVVATVDLSSIQSSLDNIYTVLIALLIAVCAYIIISIIRGLLL
jgi:hypothetical protein